MAGLKTISILSLIVFVALARLSLAFAGSIVINPTAACPGAQFIVLADIDVSGGGSIVTRVGLSSNPDGLIDDYVCHLDEIINGGIGVDCPALISDCAGAGPYTVTVAARDAQGTIVGSDSIQFTVLAHCRNVCLAPTPHPTPHAPVGGCVQPVNTFALLSPWLAVIGVVGCIGIVVVAKKRR